MLVHLFYARSLAYLSFFFIKRNKCLCLTLRSFRTQWAWMDSPSSILTALFFFLFSWPEGRWWFTLYLSRAESSPHQVTIGATRPSQLKGYFQRGRRTQPSFSDAEGCTRWIRSLPGICHDKSRSGFFSPEETTEWQRAGQAATTRQWDVSLGRWMTQLSVAWTASGINIYMARFWLSPSRKDTAFADHLSHVL